MPWNGRRRHLVYRVICWRGPYREGTGLTMDTAPWIAILGQRDEPTDAVEDYCRLLGDALAEKGRSLELVRVPWTERGWFSALRWLGRQSAGWQGRWVLVQYTALSWSRWGFPIGLILVLWALKRAGVKVGLVFHDAVAFSGARLRDHLRRKVQVTVMRWGARMADRVVSTIPPKRVPWMEEAEICRNTITIPVGSNVPERWQQVQRSRSGAPTVAVFGVTEQHKEEAARIARVAREAARRVGLVRLLVLGRGARLAEPTLRESLKGCAVDLEIHGVLNAPEVSDLMAQADVQLFVRSGVSAKRGSAIAGICCGLPIIGYADAETSFPITEAGFRAAQLNDVEGLVNELVAVLTNEQSRSQLAERSRQAAQKYFSWDVIANQFVAALKTSGEGRAQG